MTGPPASATGAPDRRRSWRFLAAPGWIATIVGTLLFAAACWAVLAPWQFSRNAERSATNTQVQAAAAAVPRPVDALLSTTAPPAPSSTWQPATATGTFEPQLQVWVRLRQDGNGQPASEVVVPLRLADGTALLVDRGYVTVAAVSADFSPPALPTGQVTVTGRVQPLQPDPLRRAPKTVDGRTEVLGIDAAGIPGLTGPVMQGFIQLTADSPGVLVPIGMPQTDEGPFLSYALQWCAFGAMALLAMGFFVVREYRDPRPDDDDRPEKAARGFDRTQLYDAR